jgi:hypothetical protein
MENMDEVLTASLKDRLNSMKTQQKNASFAEVLALATVAIGKYALLTLLIWWGWNTMESAFGITHLGYWQILSIIVCFRSISMALIDPILSPANKKKA